MEAIFAPHQASMPWLEKSTCLLVRAGSYAYGTNTPGSDEDYKGIAIPPLEYFHGFAHRFEQAETKKPDAVIYDVRKFLRLAADANPSILEVLFADEEHRLKRDLNGHSLLAARDLFLTKKVEHTFAGYAVSQLHRLRRREDGEFNGKHAMHCVRLLRMGIEILETGKVNVDRRKVGDAEELLDIRLGRGKWSGTPLERFRLLEEYASSLLKRIEEASDETKLPWGPDIDRIDRLCQGIVSCHLFLWAA
jgi:hypothetical protein